MPNRLFKLRVLIFVVVAFALIALAYFYGVGAP